MTNASSATTKVIFRADKETEEINAFFPELPGTNDPFKDCLGYCHRGQHGAFNLDYYWESTRPATPDEYADLLRELQQIYDGQLKPVSRMTRADQEKRKAQVFRAAGLQPNGLKAP